MIYPSLTLLMALVAMIKGRLLERVAIFNPVSSRILFLGGSRCYYLWVRRS